MKRSKLDKWSHCTYIRRLTWKKPQSLHAVSSFNSSSLFLHERSDKLMRGISEESWGIKLTFSILIYFPGTSKGSFLTISWTFGTAIIRAAWAISSISVGEWYVIWPRGSTGLSFISYHTIVFSGIFEWFFLKGGRAF